MPANKQRTSVDEAEVSRFSQMAEEWWDPSGKFRPLHQINPIRVQFIRNQLCQHFSKDPEVFGCLDGLSILDVGCGGGLLCEPMSRLGAQVTGIDPSDKNIQIAQIHRNQQDLEIDYRSSTAEELVDGKERFDVVLCMEVIEHVIDPEEFTKTCANLVKPGGMLFMSTLNRTLKSFALAIVGAEYILNWLPKGTHQWDKFIKPDELQKMLGSAGMQHADLEGVIYSPFQDKWLASSDTDVNYQLCAKKSA